jgi:hypothetical protein
LAHSAMIHSSKPQLVKPNFVRLYLGINCINLFFRIITWIRFSCDSRKACAWFLLKILIQYNFKQFFVVKVLGVQCLSGTGALRLGAEFLHQCLAKKTIHFSDPTWLSFSFIPWFFRAFSYYRNGHECIFRGGGFRNLKKYVKIFILINFSEKYFDKLIYFNLSIPINIQKLIFFQLIYSVTMTARNTAWSLMECWRI